MDISYFHNKLSEIGIQPSNRIYNSFMNILDKNPDMCKFNDFFMNLLIIIMIIVILYQSL